MKRTCTILCLVLLSTATAAADGDVHSLPLILHPTAPPAPALKYPLLPEVRDTIPGNAVTHYRQAVKNMKQDAPPRGDWEPTVDKWLAFSLKDFPREEVGKFLKQCETTFQEVEAGARSENCDWELTERLRKKGIATLLPDVQEMRSVASLLALRIRYELATGRTDKAVGTLRVGFALARHVADQPSLICALVGAAVAALMENRLEELIQQPDAPNLYWALTDLPRPFIDMRRPMQGERVVVYGTFPGMAETAADLNAKPFTPEQVEKAISMLRFLKDRNNDVQRLTNDAVMALQVAAHHEAAKKTLIDQGRPKELVDAMPHFQVGLLVALQQYDEWFDESLKWRNLPFWESQAEMTKAAKRIDGMRDDRNSPALGIARLLLPAVQKILSASVRTDRRIAALRCVEAVRLYAAAHDGKLPSSLEQIKDAPAPPDPVTGKPFDYRVAGDHAFLTCVPFPGQPPSSANTPKYELSIQRQ
jgi:hypothetical protein